MTKKPQGDYLLIIDASSFVHRAYHANTKLIRSDGLETGALYGFVNTMLKLTRLNWSAIERLPSHAVIVLDVRGKNWRHDLDATYKAQRKPYEDGLLVQLPWIPTIAEAFNVPTIGVAGFEADDLVATYVDKAIAYGMDAVIASSDKDLMCLVGEYDVEGAGVSVIGYDSMRDKGRDDCAGAIIGDAEIKAKFGVWPSQICDYLALTGDVADNIAGVPGFGTKTAARLLTEFENLKNLIEAAEWEPERFKSAKEAAKIVEYQRTIRASRKLVELRNDVPVSLDIKDLRLRPQSSHVLRSLIMDLEFMSLVDKVDRPSR